MSSRSKGRRRQSLGGSAVGPRTIADEISVAAHLVDQLQADGLKPKGRAKSFSELLGQCEKLAEQQQHEPVRMVHHLACTGGTLISKCIAAMPNTYLLSEVDPLSTLQRPRTPPIFSPTDLFYLLGCSPRHVNDEVYLATFSAEVESLRYELAVRGQRLVLRDHAHSQFCTQIDFSARPTLKVMLGKELNTASVVTVRHPVDSYLSLKRNDWVHFEPQNFDEYCRRYHAFLDAYSDCRLFLYEEFVREPHRIMNMICTTLELPYSESFYETFSIFSLTGDSGRSSDRIQARDRRTVPKDVREEALKSKLYSELCERLGYDESLS